MNNKKPSPKITFAPGCFDNFEGTQEELDALVSEIERMVETGEIFEGSNHLDFDSLDDEELEQLEILLKTIETGDTGAPKTQRGRFLN